MTRCNRPVRFNIAVDEALGQGEHPPVTPDLPASLAPITVADSGSQETASTHVANRRHEDELIGCTTPDCQRR